MTEAIAPQIPDQDVFNEVMVPELSAETFTLCGKTVRMMPLSLRNEMKLYRNLKNLGKEVAQAASAGDWGILDKLEEQEDALLEIVLMICENDGQPLTKDDILEQREVNLSDLLKIVANFCRKQEALQAAVDFFMNVAIPKAEELIKLKTWEHMQAVEAEIDFLKKLQEQTLSSNSSVEDTDGQLNIALD